MLGEGMFTQERDGGDQVGGLVGMLVMTEKEIVNWGRGFCVWCLLRGGSSRNGKVVKFCCLFCRWIGIEFVN